MAHTPVSRRDALPLMAAASVAPWFGPPAPAAAGDPPPVPRRDALRLMAAASVAPWFGPLARAAAGDPARKRSCILLWMTGGPSTIDLFDLKPGHENGGPYKPAKTAAPGVAVCEHLP